MGGGQGGGMGGGRGGGGVEWVEDRGGGGGMGGGRGGGGGGVEMGIFHSKPSGRYDKARKAAPKVVCHPCVSLRGERLASVR